MREERSEGEEHGRSVWGMEIGRGETSREVPRGGHLPVYSAQNNTQRGPCHCFGITNTP